MRSDREAGSAASLTPWGKGCVSLVLMVFLCAVWGTELCVWAAGDEPVMLFGIGVHIEPFGAQVSPIALAAGAEPRRTDPRQMNYTDRRTFERHGEDLLRLAALVEVYGGRLTIQAQTPFTASAARFGSTVLRDLSNRGHEIGLHFHENVHLGNGSEALPPDVWTDVMREQLEWIARAGVEEPVRFWSGGNLYPALFEAASTAGLSINGDWKDPQTQSVPAAMLGVHPWRPAGGTDGIDIDAFVTHDPYGEILFLPGGWIDPAAFSSKREITAQGGLAAWLAVLEQALLASIDLAQADRVNAFHFTVHPGEFAGDPTEPYGLLEAFLRDVVDPLVAAGRIRWATFSEMAGAVEAWEDEHPEADPRGGSGTG